MCRGVHEKCPPPSPTLMLSWVWPHRSRNGKVCTTPGNPGKLLEFYSYVKKEIKLLALPFTQTLSNLVAQKSKQHNFFKHLHHEISEFWFPEILYLYPGKCLELHHLWLVMHSGLGVVKMLPQFCTWSKMLWWNVLLRDAFLHFIPIRKFMIYLCTNHFVSHV